jgi:hypothetical protein
MPYGSRSSWLSPHDAARSSRAPSGARADPRPCHPIPPEPKDGREVAPAHHNHRSADGAKSAAQHRVERDRRGDHRRVPASHAFATRRRSGVLSSESLPKLSRSALHRCLERHGIARLPKDPEKASKHQRFAETKIGYVHIDVCELRSAEGKVCMFLAIDWVSKFAYVELHPAATMLNGAAFRRSAVEAFPYRIYTVLTDNGTSFGPKLHHPGEQEDQRRREVAIAAGELLVLDKAPAKVLSAPMPAMTATSARRNVITARSRRLTATRGDCRRARA